MNKEMNKLGTEKIDKLLFKMSMPAVIGMMVNALYNVVDTIFIARGVGTDAIGGLAIAFPIQILIMAFGMLFGTGAASIISRALGEGNHDKANSSAGNVLIISGIVGILIAIPSMIFIEPILQLFGATDNLLPYSKSYMEVILLGAPLIIFLMGGNNIARAEGNAKVAMVSMVIGTGLNIVLDPIFIFIFNLGIRGAALATIISQFVSVIYLLNYFIRGKSSLHFTKHALTLQPKIVVSILSLGVPSFIRQAGGSFVAVILNNALGTYGGDIAISTFGVMNRLLMLGLMPLFGIAQGFQPIAGYNFGAKKMDRLWEVLKHSMVYATILCLIYSSILFFFPEFMLSIFSTDPELISLGSYAMNYIIMFLPFIGIQVVGSTYFLAIGKIAPSFVLGLSRQVILLLPLVLILPKFLGIQGIWLSFPIADGLALLLTVTWLVLDIIYLRKKELNKC
ncbi:MATE family efflux transporter [Thiospirochaeta perfilievii]|uniref:Multidrug export protein MepA n=1 Tax=Thiospirochaeta perfilievii TaxID=252967 RepID=A0A5C1QG60_9SPIO|nr:MATE family efflux transporter [Thiospirochaeta perfilievii]QEN06059.1 MATE family efflux transporter [Thiospirochaeta perfilievii]